MSFKVAIDFLEQLEKKTFNSETKKRIFNKHWEEYMLREIEHFEIAYIIFDTSYMERNNINYERKYRSFVKELQYCLKSLFPNNQLKTDGVFGYKTIDFINHRIKTIDDLELLLDYYITYRKYDFFSQSKKYNRFKVVLTALSNRMMDIQDMLEKHRFN